MKKFILHCNVMCYDTQGGGDFYSRPTTVIEAPDLETAKRKAERKFKQQYENFRTKVGSVSFALVKELSK